MHTTEAKGMVWHVDMYVFRECPTPGIWLPWLPAPPTPEQREGYKLNLVRLIRHPTFKFKNSQEFEKNTGQKSGIKMMFSPFKGGKTATLLLLVIYLSFQDTVVSGTVPYFIHVHVPHSR